MQDFEKVVNPGTVMINHRSRQVFVKIVYTNNRLSITGVEGPTPSGNCYGSCGQIRLDDVKSNEDWTADKIAELDQIWQTWHLNDMRSHCEHQQKNWNLDKLVEVTTYGLQVNLHKLMQQATWGELTVEQYTDFKNVMQQVKPIVIDHKYISDQDAQQLSQYIVPRKTELRHINWLRPDEHPEGILTKPCEICGYKYGTAHLMVNVPENILETLISYPDAKIKPAWV